MPRSSRTSAGAIFLNKARRIDALRQAASRAQAALPLIQRLILFGSLAQGTPTPRSDADILVVVETSEHAQPRDRVPDVLRALSPLPCPVDVFVLTDDEFERARRDGNPLVREALGSGLDLL
jgi:predicted nucleotidyltransferase